MIADQLDTTHMLQNIQLLVSDAVATKENSGGWWDNYLNLYKTCLLFVHDTIDQPLRNTGWDQTWGVSIAVFTAGKIVYHSMTIYSTSISLFRTKHSFQTLYIRTAVRTALLPLSIEQTKSQEYTKALKPKQDELKEKFKDNPDMLNRATAKLFEDAKANPLTGCLVSIIQLPILIGLYRSITLLAQEGRLEEPFLWIPSLEGPVSAATDYRGMDWLTSGWFDGHPSMGWEGTLPFLIMPVLLVLGQSATMSVLTPPTDTSKMSEEEKQQLDQTQGVLKFLPLLIGFFSLQVPAALTIYWFTSNIYSVTQTLAIRKYFEINPPKIELPDYWNSLDDMENMSAEKKREAAEAGLALGPKWEDVLDEAKYHYVVERTPLREGSRAWERVQKEQISIPLEMQAWVEVEEKETTNV
jgi:YidC/Oxa1 family membrane protein insertase